MAHGSRAHPKPPIRDSGTCQIKIAIGGFAGDGDGAVPSRVGLAGIEYRREGMGSGVGDEEEGEEGRHKRLSLRTSSNSTAEACVRST